jgi:hypothetical protein
LYGLRKTNNRSKRGTVAVFILTQAGRLEDCKDNIYRVQAPHLEDEYLSGGYSRHERSYQLKYLHKEYVVLCPEFRNGTESIVLVPEFLVPGRIYPVYVYMYAIDLYSGAPEKGQRWAAEETRKQFGLVSFAHTTLGRALKAFIGIIGGNALTSDETDTQTPESDKKKNSFPTVQSTAPLRKKAVCFFQGRLIQAGLQKIISVCCGIAREWFKVCRRFLL